MVKKMNLWTFTYEYLHILSPREYGRLCFICCVYIYGWLLSSSQVVGQILFMFEAQCPVHMNIPAPKIAPLQVGSKTQDGNYV
jgi:hypothetical protein